MTKDEALKMSLEALEEACELIGPAWAWRDEKGRPAITAIKEVLAQEQEPVAKKKHEPTIDLGKYAGTYGGYTTPPAQRTWVGLTKEEIAEFDTWHDNREEEVGWCNPSEIVAYIEAKLKEKNT